MKLKTIFYSRIMFVETAIKNYSLEVIIDEAKSSRFADIYATIMNDYRSHSVGSRNYKAAINERMNVRNRIYSNISRDYGKNNIINYYYDSNRTVPIWAIFEILSLGACGVGTGVGLGEAEGADPLAGGELGQVFHLLLLGAGLKDGGAAEGGVG